MDITEKRLPQDGRAVLKERGRRFHLRLSTLPTVHGESLVIRLLDQTMPGQDFAQLGLAAPQADALRAALAGPAGLIYLTGPTGSGKTTTLHAALHALDHEAGHPHAGGPGGSSSPGIRQTEIREKIGLVVRDLAARTPAAEPRYSAGRRNADAETAQLAIRAALTGHLVLSTLHTNDALAAIPRLRDLGVESFLLAASLRLVAAQRLVRRLCRVQRAAPENARLREEHRMPDAEFCRAVGCPACRGRGFQGRLAIHEVISAEKYLPLIAANAPSAIWPRCGSRRHRHALAARAHGGSAGANHYRAGRPRPLIFLTGPPGP
jgi:type II secretory ATPase GspE/PulE/Tfp pilus assembly ATPase PilB-like protein